MGHTVSVPSIHFTDGHTEAQLPRQLAMELNGAGKPWVSIFAVSGSKHVTPALLLPGLAGGRSWASVSYLCKGQEAHGTIPI